MEKLSLLFPAQCDRGQQTFSPALTRLPLLMLLLLRNAQTFPGHSGLGHKGGIDALFFPPTLHTPFTGPRSKGERGSHLPSFLLLTGWLELSHLVSQVDHFPPVGHYSGRTPPTNTSDEVDTRPETPSQKQLLPKL